MTNIQTITAHSHKFALNIRHPELDSGSRFCQYSKYSALKVHNKFRMTENKT